MSDPTFDDVPAGPDPRPESGLHGEGPAIRFERFARMAGRLFDVPSVVISVRARSGGIEIFHWGVDLNNAHFCAEVMDAEDMLVRDDLTAPDGVTGPIFHAGVPLVLPGVRG